MYKNLNIEQAKIISSINYYLKEKFDNYYLSNEFHKIDKTRRRVNIHINQDKFYLDFHFKKNGTTTIEINDSKKNIAELKKEIADYIISSTDCIIGNSLNKSNEIFVLENIKEEELKEIIEAMKDDDLIVDIEKQKDTPELSIYKLTGPQNDTVTISFYNKKNGENKITCQGIPLILYNELFIYITTILEKNDLSKLYRERYGEELVEKNESELLKNYLPNAYEHIKAINPLNKLLLQSIYDLNRKNVDEVLYDGYIIAATRAMEGFLKIILAHHYNIDIPERKLPKFAPRDNVFSDKYYLNEDDAKKIKDKIILDHINDCYNYYMKNRHKHTHYDSPKGCLKYGEGTSVLKTKDESDRIITDILNKIDEYYKLIDI